MSKTVRLSGLLAIALMAGVPGIAGAAAAGKPAPAPAADWKPPAKRVSPGEAYAKQAQFMTDAPPPRAADGHPDLSGVWGNPPSPAGEGDIRPGNNESDQAVLQRGAGWDKPLYKPEFWAKVRSLDFSKADVDPVFSCRRDGVPRQNAPNKIVQTAKEIMMWNGANVRVIPIDGRARDDEDEDQAYDNGVPLGHWDGDTLVVESVGFNDTTWLQWQGYFHTDRMKVTERFWRKGNLLFYNFTVDDPDVLVHPWTQNTLVRRLNPGLPRVNEPNPCVVTPIEGDPYSRG